MEIDNFSLKRLQINKANMTVVIAVAITTFLFIFAIFAGKALLSQRAYQAKVISKQTVAKNTIQQNIKARDDLVAHYKDFVASPVNIIGGQSSGTGDRDGDNARIVLDALPSQYDFPALASSMEKLARDNGTSFSGLTGSDDEVNQQKKAKTTTSPIEIPFELSVGGNYASIQQLAKVLERSIRPIKVGKLSISGGDANLKMMISAKTYYQPASGVRVTTETVK